MGAVVVGVLLAGALVLTWRLGWAARVLGVVMALGAAACVLGDVDVRDDVAREREYDGYRPKRHPAGGYVGSKACRSCHPGAYASWVDTHHARMTQLARPDTVMAPSWDGTVLKHGPREYRLLRRGNRFLVDMPRFGTDGQSAQDRMTLPIVMTTGSHHQQLYWIPVPWSGPDERFEGEGDIGKADYDAHCNTCHGPEGLGGVMPVSGGHEPIASALYEEDLTGPEIADALATPAHKRLVGKPLDAATESRIVRYVVRLQYGDRLMQFPFAWFIRDSRWVHEDYTFVQVQEHPRDVEPYDEGWSNACDQCHSLRPRFKSRNASQPGDAKVVELGIVCEHCHGPGEAHAKHHRNPMRRYREHLTDEAAGDIVLPTRLDKHLSASICAQCHGENLQKGDFSAPMRFKPGESIEKYVHVVQRDLPVKEPVMIAALKDEPQLLEDGFWGDGTIRVAGRDYNGLKKTACYTKGELTCTTCHSMHSYVAKDDQLKPGAREGKPCVSCHAEIADDVSAHTHHGPASPGSACMNCHMPHTTMGLLSTMRAHRIDSPNMVRSMRSGRPNACASCHVDATAETMAKALTDWYGQAPLRANDRTRAPMAPSIAATLDDLLRGDAVQRGVAVWHLGWPDSAHGGLWWRAPWIAQLLDDPYAAVRYMAWKSILRMPGFEDFEYDYVADAKTLAASRERALKRWRARGETRSLPAALIVAGKLDLEAMARRKALRDDRPVSVSE